LTQATQSRKGAPVADDDLAPAAQWLADKEEVDDPVAHVLGILA